MRATSASPIQPSPSEVSAASRVPAATALTVQPVAVAGAGLDGVAEGVAEVEQRAVAALMLVRRRRPPP
jgi:hypothetical protein